MVPSQDGETIPATPLSGDCEIHPDRQNSTLLKAEETKEEKLHWFSIGWVMATSPELFLPEPVPPWHSTGGWNETARDANRHQGPNMKELRSGRLNNLFWRPSLPVKQSFPAQLWTNINTTRVRNSWDWHFITWLSQSQATPLSHELNKGCSTLPEVCDSKASCTLQFFLITTVVW